MARAAAGVGGLAIAAAFVVSCSEAKEATKDVMSSASSVGSSAASAAGSVASSAGSAAGSAASSVGSAASSAVSSGASAASSAVSSGASAASSAVSSVVEGATTMNVPGVGDVSLDADTAAAYTRLGGAASLGAPTGMSEKVGDGSMTPFANGTIYTSPAGTYLVQGEILRVYNEQGGPAGALGFPTADETTTGGGPKTANGGWISEFQNGSITWTNSGAGGFTETVTKK
ncbi:MAG: hypothetical protein FGM52_14595 [Mycobacterium sp.]|nr:hypothetical protein [Mycobacterium sp.]